MLDRIEFLLSEAITSLKRNNWMTFAAINTSAMALFILGGLTYLYVSVSAYAATLQDRFEMKVFLKEGVSVEQKQALEPRIKAIDGVRSVVFKDKATVLQEFKRDNPGIEMETKGLELDNPMPDTYVVTYRELRKADEIARVIAGFPEVEPNGVNYLADEQRFLDQSLVAMRWLGVILGGVMLLTSGVLIYNTIRLTIMARRREIRIMELVGANRFMVWTPMFIEGVIQGLTGGLLATGVLFVTHVIVGALMGAFFRGQGIGAFPLASLLTWLLIAGGLYGLLCSYLAIREPKRKLKEAKA
ncbi:MAG: ABC transporter permease [Fimbriimonadaceae bacterium]|jgi:cell division transport system permease protein|nr:ABC transporter permease [Fimbriimonadaceae bacterium]